MEIFWLIISIVVGFFSGCIWYFTYRIKNTDQQTWDKLYEKLNEDQVDLPEDVVYNIVLKSNKVSSIILCICLVIIVICICSLIIK